MDGKDHSPHQSEIGEELRRLAADSTRDLFAAYDVQLRPVTSADEGPGGFALAGVIGYTSESIRGTLLMGLSTGPLERSRPSAESPLADWAAELANQLVGRFKNRLLRYGVEASISTPLVIRGDRITPAGKGADRPLAFTSEQGSVFVWVDFNALPGLELVEAPPSESARGEGDLILF